MCVETKRKERFKRKRAAMAAQVSGDQPGLYPYPPFTATSSALRSTSSTPHADFPARAPPPPSSERTVGLQTRSAACSIPRADPFMDSATLVKNFDAVLAEVLSHTQERPISMSFDSLTCHINGKLILTDGTGAMPAKQATPPLYPLLVSRHCAPAVRARAAVLGAPCCGPPLCR